MAYASTQQARLTGNVLCLFEFMDQNCRDSSAQTGNKRLPMTPDAPESPAGDPDPAPAAPREPCRRAEISGIQRPARPERA
jgi:hypothetical protein